MIPIDPMKPNGAVPPTGNAFDWTGITKAAIAVVTMFVPGQPEPQPRQRHRVAFAPNGEPYAHNYTPRDAAVAAYKDALRLCFLSAAGNGWNTYAGPVAVWADFVFSRPERLTWKRKPMPTVPHLAKPDADNLLKSTADALNGYAWRDDSAIWASQAWKRYAAGDERPGTNLRIYYLAAG